MNPNLRLASKTKGNFIMFKKIAGVLIAVAPLSANAAIDVSGAIIAFGDINTAVPLVGAAFLGALGLMAAWKLARGLFA